MSPPCSHQGPFAPFDQLLAAGADVLASIVRDMVAVHGAVPGSVALVLTDVANLRWFDRCPRPLEWRAYRDHPAAEPVTLTLRRPDLAARVGARACVGCCAALLTMPDDRVPVYFRAGGSFNAWRDVTPMHNALVDTMLGSPIHVIATLRAKMEHAQEKDATGRTVIRKLGVSAIQREGIEYEFQVVGDLDADHALTITKTRCPVIAGKTFLPTQTRNLAAILAAWLGTPAAAAPPAPAVAQDTPAQDTPAQDTPATVAPAVPPELADFYTRVSEIELPGEAVAVWIARRGTLTALLADDRERAWKALCKRTEEVGKMKNAKVWLKKAIAEEDHRKATDPPPPPAAPSPAAPPTNGASGARSTAPQRPAGTGGPRALAPVVTIDGEVLETEEAMRDHLKTFGNSPALRNSYHRHADHATYARLAYQRAAALVGCDEVTAETLLRGSHVRAA